MSPVTLYDILLEEGAGKRCSECGVSPVTLYDILLEEGAGKRCSECGVSPVRLDKEGYVLEMDDIDKRTSLWYCVSAAKDIKIKLNVAFMEWGQEADHSSLSLTD